MEKTEVILPGWETVRCIGSGSTGTVYELRKKDEYGADYGSALKVITVPATQKEYDEMSASMSEFAMRAKLRDRVEEISSEYRLMGSLRGHPNIVNCEDQMIVPHTDDLGWDIYIRMELLCSLPDHVAQHGMQLSEVIKLGIDMCSALELCREGHIIHRDIKPQNIFVSRYGSFKLGDFSVARMAGTQSLDDMAGTYSYMAPEVFKGKAYDDRVDIYSLGMVLYSLLNSQRTPFLPLDRKPAQEEISEAQHRRFDGEPLPPPKFGSPALKKLVLKACAFLPEDRFGSPTEMKQALQKLAAEKTAAGSDITGDETVREENPERPVKPPKTPPPIQEEKPEQKAEPEPAKKQETKQKTDKPDRSGAAITVLAVIVALLCLAIVLILVIGNSGGGDTPDDPVKTGKPVKTEEPSKEPEITAIMVSSPRLIMTAGESSVLTVELLPETVRRPVLIWKSSDRNIVDVDSTGNVTALAEGTATVMVYVSTKMELYDQCMVIVEKPVVTSLEIEQMPTRTVYGLGEQLDTTGLVLVAHYNNGTEKRITDPAEYTVICNMDGIGSRKATVSYEGETAEYTVRVSLFG